MIDQHRILHELLGSRLPKDIKNTNGAVVVPQDKTLTPEIVEKALKHDLCDLDAEFFDYGRLICDLTDEVDELFMFVRERETVPVQEIRETIVPVIVKLSEYKNVTQLLCFLQRHNEYTVRHSLGVSVLTSSIGKSIGLSPSDLEELTIAATLHDIGKACVPSDLLNKPGKLTDEEFKTVKEHAIYGYQIMEKSEGINYKQSLVALQHHERLDGSGYPFGLKGDQISQYARIVAIADVFHAMYSKRAYSEAAPLFQILSELHTGKGKRYDYGYTHVFMEKASLGLIGTVLTLSDGTQGTVIDVDAKNPLFPTIQHESGQVIELSTQTDLQISVEAS